MIAAHGVWKSFRRSREQPLSLKNLLLLRRRPLERRWVLRDVTFAVAPGETVGIVGKNGCGKTTLLRLLAGILRAERGRIEVRGRLAALLALGAGFHPDLTGEENVYLNASILGFSRRDARSRYAAIAGFSGLGEQLQTPLRFYSSGMVVRLGFSVAVHLDPEILLVDEVLAVGDADFRRRCHDHMRELRRTGRSILLVSHDMDEIRAYADRVLWLDDGTIAASGAPADVVPAYLASYR
jgi:ABC-type polysaccharide/polyol phosphate transport system ATPase subunit